MHVLIIGTHWKLKIGRLWKDPWVPYYVWNAAYTIKGAEVLEAIHLIHLGCLILHLFLLSLLANLGIRLIESLIHTSAKVIVRGQCSSCWCSLRLLLLLLLLIDFRCWHSLDAIVFIRACTSRAKIVDVGNLVWLLLLLRHKNAPNVVWHRASCRLEACKKILERRSVARRLKDFSLLETLGITIIILCVAT